MHTANPRWLTVAANRSIMSGMGDLCRLIWCVMIGLFRSRAAVHAENIVLRHQLNVLQRKSPKRLVFSNVDRLVFDLLMKQIAGDTARDNEKAEDDHAAGHRRVVCTPSLVVRESTVGSQVDE